ncbi:MAG: filamentous hemagglutinin N-terminal domain-containing protein, partial [Candidatus Omnitrophica bacterium]|nr:filamentous hemagglutinin N-terminal domain-containing protein [Candidatus Omnitrophota bacterium]
MRSFKKSKKISICKIAVSAIFLFLFSPICFSQNLPDGGTVVDGSATINYTNPTTVDINIASDKSIIDWNSYNVAAGHTVNYNRDSSFISLNRVTGVNPSEIFGTINAQNGQIFLVNPNGIIFGSGSHVNAAGLVASTLDISNEDFMKGNYEFFKVAGKNGSIVNKGIIRTTKPGGYVCLFSQAIDNQGVAIADLGTVALAAGEEITMSLDDKGLISVVVAKEVQSTILDADGNRMDSAIKNSGTLSANGGKVILTAEVLNGVFDYAINNLGVIQAAALDEHDGVIELKASGAPVINMGNITASASIDANIANASFVNEGDIEAAKVTVTVENGNLTNKGNITAGKATLSVVNGILTNKGVISGLNSLSSLYDGNIFINALNVVQDGIITADNKIEIIADSVTTTLDQNPSTNPGNTAIITANQVNIITKKIGSTSLPVLINTPQLNIRITQGDINVLDSLGIGTNVLLRGPPEGFGAIIYNSSTNLTLEAKEGNITIYADILANGLSLIASQTINIHSNLYATSGSINIESINKGDINVYALISAPNGVVRLWTCGSMDLREATVISKDGGYVYNPEDAIAVSWVGNDGNWSVAANWSGGVVPNSNNFSVTINKSNADVILDGDYTIGSLILGNSRTCSLTLNGNLILDASVVNGTTGNLIIGFRGTLNAGIYSIKIDGDWDNSGTFNAGTGTVEFTKASGTQHLTSGGTGAGKAFYHLIHSGNGELNLDSDNINIDGNFTNSAGTFQADDRDIYLAGDWTNSAIYYCGSGGNTVYFDGGSTQEINTGGMASTQDFDNIRISGSTLKVVSNGLKINGTLTIDSGKTLDLNGQNLTLDTLSNNGTLQLTGDETVSISDMDTNSGLVRYVAASGTRNIKDFGSNDYWNLEIASAGTGTFTLGANLHVRNNLTVTKGTLNAGAKTIDTDNDVYIAADGILTAPSTTFNVGGDWTNDGGIFNHNSGTVIFDGGTVAINVNTSETFYNLTFDASGTKTIASGDTLAIYGTLNLDNGTINGGTLEAKGNVNVESSFDGGNTALVFSGDNVQSFDLSGAE